MDRYEDHVLTGWHDGFLHRYTIAPLPRHHRHAHTELEWNLVVAWTGR